jgi:hypothetical protein
LVNVDGLALGLELRDDTEFGKKPLALVLCVAENFDDV